MALPHRAAIRSTASRSPTSQTSYSPSISAAAARRRSSRRPTSTHRQPLPASRRASAAPIPHDAARDDRYLHKRTTREATASRPRPESTTARSRCRPPRCLAPATSRVEPGGAVPVRRDAPLSVEETHGADAARRVATTSSSLVAAQAAAAPRQEPVAVVPRTARMRATRKLVFGITFGPKLLTFFDSWKSDAREERARPAASKLRRRRSGARRWPRQSSSRRRIAPRTTACSRPAARTDRLLRPWSRRSYGERRAARPRRDA